MRNSRVNNSIILRIKDETLSRYYFYINYINIVHPRIHIESRKLHVNSVSGTIKTNVYSKTKEKSLFSDTPLSGLK